MVHQGGFSGSRYTGHHIEFLQVKNNIDMVQVPGGGSFHPDFPCARCSPDPVLLTEDSTVERQRRARLHGIQRQFKKLLRSAVEQDLSPAGSCAGAQIGDPVGMPEEDLVVFHYDNGISLVADLLQNSDELTDIVRMESDRGLIEDTDQAAQVHPSEGCEPKPSGISRGEGSRFPVGGKVAQPESFQQPGQLRNLLQHRLRDETILSAEGNGLQDAGQQTDLSSRQVGDGMFSDLDGPGFFVQPGTSTRTASAATDEAENVLVPVAPEDGFHHREYTLVMAHLPRLCRNPAPLHARFQRVLPVRDLDFIASVKDNVFLLSGEVFPWDVDGESFRPANLVEHVERHLGVDDVPVGGSDHQCPFP